MSSWGTPLIVVVFVAAGIATWIAGLYLSKATDVLDERFGLGEAVGGMLLLGLAGSLPELAIVSSAALSGHLALATGNLLGGIAIQTLVLVFLDATSRRRRPLTSLVSSTSPLIECMLVIVLVTIAVMGGFLPESTSVGSVSPASLAIVVFFLLGMLGLNRRGGDRSGRRPGRKSRSPESSPTDCLSAWTESGSDWDATRGSCCWSTSSASYS